MKAIDLPNPAFIARFMPKAAPAPEPIKRRPLPAMPRWFGDYLRTLNVGWKFTVAGCAEKTGRTPEAVRVCIWHASQRGLVRLHGREQGARKIVWRRTARQASPESLRQSGVDLIAKIADGGEFTRGDMEAKTTFWIANKAIARARKDGLIEAVAREQRPETTYKKVKNEDN